MGLGLGVMSLLHHVDVGGIANCNLFAHLSPGPGGGMVHLELEEGAFAAGPWIDALKGRGGGEAGGADMVLRYMRRR